MNLAMTKSTIGNELVRVCPCMSRYVPVCVSLCVCVSMRVCVCGGGGGVWACAFTQKATQGQFSPVFVSFSLRIYIYIYISLSPTHTHTTMADDSSPPSLTTTTTDVKLEAPTSTSTSTGTGTCTPIVVDTAPGPGDSELEPVPEARRVFMTALKSVVKIFCCATTPHYALPWQKKRPKMSTSSGFVIQGRRILCNAHGTNHATSLRVRKHGDPVKYRAKLHRIGHSYDLAILTVDDETFWKDMHPLEFGGVPQLQETAIVLGYPTGGDAVSVTKGVVSRVVVAKYSYSGETLLAVQIDAAINPGNSGGPAMLGSKVVGVAFSGLSNAQNIGYIIPIPLVQHFLTYTEQVDVCAAGFRWQTLESPSMRKYLKVSNTGALRHIGVVIDDIFPLETAKGVLESDDVLINIDGEEVGSDGTIQFRDGERVPFYELLTRKPIGYACPVTIFRKGEKMELTIPLGPRQRLVPLHLHDKPPSYFVFGGLVFTVLSRQYLAHEYGSQWWKKAPVRLCDVAFYGIKEQPGQQSVILNQVLQADINMGFHSLRNTQVRKVDGHDIKNIAQLVEILRDIEQDEKRTDDFVRFDFDLGTMVVLEVSEVMEHGSEILEQHNIAFDCSPDLRELRNATPDIKDIDSESHHAVAVTVGADTTQENEVAIVKDTQVAQQETVTTQSADTTEDDK
jgi:S1-C subfamily serine protease